MKVDVCTIKIGDVVLLMRIVADNNEVLEVRELAEEEYAKVNEILQRRCEARLTKIIGLPTLCLTYYDVDRGTIEEITKYGKIIPRDD